VVGAGDIPVVVGCDAACTIVVAVVVVVSMIVKAAAGLGRFG